MASQVLRQIPSTSSIREVERQLQQYDPWFYQFEFENGATTVVHSAAVADIHRTRADIILPFVDHYFRDRWSQVRCLDVACHQGWFATQIALRGPKSVEGVDIRAEHIVQASLIRDLGDLRHLSFREADIYQFGAPPCELTLCLGLLYHLENPLGALRCMRALTSELCIVETQVAKAEGELQCLWGSGLPRKGPGIAVVPADPVHTGELSDVALVPTLHALFDMLYAVGFSQLYMGVPPRTVHEQFQYPGFERVVVFAQVAD
jgi:tRNA (mo5U34)-methyltransferase